MTLMNRHRPITYLCILGEDHKKQEDIYWKNRCLAKQKENQFLGPGDVSQILNENFLSIFPRKKEGGERGEGYADILEMCQEERVRATRTH